MHRVTAVVSHPEITRVIPDHPGELIVYDVHTWYYALDQLVEEWKVRHPTIYASHGADDLEVRSIAMMKMPEE